MPGIEFRIRLLRASLNKMIEDMEKRTGKKVGKSDLEEIERSLLTEEFYKSVVAVLLPVHRIMMEN